MKRPPAAGVAAGVAIGAVAVGAAALAVGSSCLQLVHTRAGIARVKGIRGEHGEKIRVLQQGGVYQSATYVGERRFEPVFAYYRAFDAMFEAEPVLCAASGHGVERVLMLGGGGYAYPKHALTQHAGLVMDVVEIDPAVTRLARRWFFLDELERLAGERLRSITADAPGYPPPAGAGGPRTPGPAAGSSSSTVKYRVMRSSSPSRLSPAAARISAPYSPRSSFCSRVRTFPRTNAVCTWGYSRLSCKIRLRLEQPKGLL